MQVIYDLWSNIKIRRISILSLAVILLLFIGYIIFNTQTSKPYSVQSLPFSNINHPYLYGNTIYSYSGESFIKTDVTSGESIRLSKSKRLPSIRNLWWAGDKGVFATFDGGLYASGMDEYIKNNSLYSYSSDELSRHFLWYIDFSDMSISLVSSQYTSNYYVSYDGSSSTAYYYTKHLDSEADYSPTSLTGSTISTYDLVLHKTINTIDIPGISNVHSISICATQSVCIVGDRDKDTQVLVEYRDSKFTNLESSSNGLILPTNNPERYIILNPTISAEQFNSLEEGDMYNGPYRLSTYNLHDKDGIDTGVIIDESDTFIALTISNNVMLYINDYKDTTYDSILYADSLIGLKLTKKYKSNNTNTLLSSVVSYGDNSAITTTINGSYVYIGQSKVNIIETVVNNSIVTDCIAKKSGTLQSSNIKNQYRILLPFSSNFNDDINSISNCIYSNPSTILGVTFIFIPIDKESGRYVSD